MKLFVRRLAIKNHKPNAVDEVNRSIVEDAALAPRPVENQESFVWP
jgi:hypothetical protein